MKSIYIDEDKSISERKANRIAKKLYKANRKEKIVIALSNRVGENTELIKKLNDYKLCILNGRWILKFLIYDILESIIIKNDKKIELQNVAILIDKMEDILFPQLLNIAEKVKSLTIVTNEIYRYSYLENMCEGYGIPLHITNNKNKSLLKTDVIINFDFNEEKIDRYKINPSAIIINIQTKIKINKDNFKGKIINDYLIKYNKENYKNFFHKENFDENILYESYIYRKDTFANIYKKMQDDKVKVITA